MRFLGLLLSIVSFAAAAPLLEPRQGGGEIIPNKYIVVMKPGSSDTALDQALGLLGEAKADFVYRANEFKGFAGTLSQSLLTSFKNLGQVAYIEPDQKVHHTVLVTQNNPPYGLARISHRNRGSNTYIYDSSAGEGTCAYIIDTGIRTDHVEFEGRATFLRNFAGDGQDTDGNGHGTHVAGTVGSRAYGVAKKATLLAVKVLDAGGSGSNSAVMAGISFAAEDFKTRAACRKGAVGNLSLGGALSPALNQAAKAAVQNGFFLAVAAGNSGLSADLFSPASESTVCTVGAVGMNDARASFSNFGRLVDLFAPGVDVLSTWNTSPTATNTISGTSMAAPHVAGLGAYLLALKGLRDPQALCQDIQNLSTKNAISNVGLRSPNNLAYNGNGA